ncbi:metalloproteinase inhibitor 3 [Diachasmimorpha longicaudata]|uniref:metalloproteinase inhibitor 3 n=1 Tax=Diachasmimorpha longicaudata TaxID=58733 RepID=UPI0030B888CA
MRRLTCWSPLIILLISAYTIENAEACSCERPHPQKQFCRADWVARVTIKTLEELSKDEAAYTIKLRKIFKATPEAEKALKKHPMLWTSPSDSTCKHMGILPNETWVIGGRIKDGKPYTVLCDLAMRWSEVTVRQRKGFRGLYNESCVCPIIYTQWRNKGQVFNSTAGKGCLWESEPGPTHCQERYGICRMGKSGCSWELSPVYKKCLNQHQRERNQKLDREP